MRHDVVLGFLLAGKKLWMYFVFLENEKSALGSALESALL